MTDKMDGMGIHRRSNRRRRGGKTAAAMRDAGATAEEEEEEEEEKETKSIDVITDEDSTSDIFPSPAWKEMEGVAVAKPVYLLALGAPPARSTPRRAS